MPTNAKVLEALKLFECVEWKYDGLGGSVIKWTKEHGNTNDDPSVLVYVLDAGEKFVTAATGREYGQPANLAKWLGEQKIEHDRKVGRLPAEMAVEWTPAVLTDGALDGLKDAIDKKQPVLIYFGIPADKKDAKEWKSARADCDKLERGALADKPLAALAAKCLAVRFDLSETEPREFVEKTWGVKKAPALVLLKGDAKPQTWTTAGVKAPEIVKALKATLGEK